jgi:hypothetical protein
MFTTSIRPSYLVREAPDAFSYARLRTSVEAAAAENDLRKEMIVIFEREEVKTVASVL